MTTSRHNRRDEIIEAAIEIFRRDGYRGATLDDIASAVGVTKAAFYYYYRNKIGLLAEIYGRVGTALYDRLLPIFGDETLSPTAKLRAVIEEHVSFAIANRDVLVIYFREINELTETTRATLLRGEQRYSHSLQQVIRDGIALGEFRADADPVAVCYALLGACNWTIFWYHDAAHGGRLSAADLAAQIHAMAVDGLLRGRVGS